ncbi:carbohydrate ABC transporter permease [Bacillus sp. JCM 19034]|uniref:carbohydrate ABC transporter permease n=1 Tax=Bacillus sp. JCM 19034 TaxID=1481928 RepID=UPI00078393FA|nr:carbohydrate ABC transporter permease [Bacillus sp. JCM 19034]
MKGKKGVTILLNIVAWLISIIVITPFIVILLNSFKTDAEATVLTLRLPEQWMFENYAIVFERGNLAVSFFNSILHSVVSTSILVILVAFAAFVLARNPSKLNQAIYFFIILGITLPLNFIPLMNVMKTLGLINSHWGMILLYTGMGLPISLFIAYAFVRNIPRELDEAAVIDGCHAFSLFYRVILPLLKPVLVTIFVLNFMNVWNEFTAPLYFLNSVDKWPVTLAVFNFFGQFSAQWNLVSANIVITSIPVLIVFIIGQKHIVGGLTSGAVKG